jgi:membrane protein DedA with SNARE-associated domain
MIWPDAALVAAATLVSEDLACIAVGLLVAAERLDPVAGVLGCLAGIYLGDLGLWLAGRVAGHRLARLPWLSQRLEPARLAEARAWLERRGARAIVASRFLPGTRVALYVGAGMLGLRPSTFATWTLAAVLVWVPAVVFATAWLGETAARVLRAWLGLGWLVGPLVAGAWILVAHVRGRARSAASAGDERPGGRGFPRAERLDLFWQRLRGWEFWPVWAFYPPVLAWIGLLALRHGGLRTLAAANPGIPEGGFVGESKHDILRRLPEAWTLPAFRVPKASAGLPHGEDRVAACLNGLAARRWPFPVVLKPDAGQRGVGVRLARSADDVRAYLSAQPGAVLVQRCHPGPYEAGIFYYRFPGEAAGRIFAITDKIFPAVEGDGRSTLEALVRRHPRYRMQARVFLRRHAGELARVLAPGERFQLAFAGNHAQGTLFRDGSHLWTPALEARIDAIARAFDGFCIGRFDVRYADVDRFKAGEDLAIVELNGATSEATNIYDPAWPLWRAYGVLFAQWSLVFRIGAANRRLGHVPATLGRLARLASSHLTRRIPLSISD